MPPVTGKDYSFTLSPGMKEGGWEEKTVVLEMDDDTTKEVKVWELGEIWIHKAVGGKLNLNSFSLTHAKTHRRLCTLSKVDDAIKAAAVLWDGCSFALSFNKPNLVVYHLPSWVKPWLIQVSRSGAYVDPPPGAVRARK